MCVCVCVRAHVHTHAYVNKSIYRWDAYIQKWWRLRPPLPFATSPPRAGEGSLAPSRQFSSVQSLSRVRLFVTRWTAAHSPSNEYSGPISFRTDWFDLAVQRTLKSLLQHHSSKASILRRSAFFTVQLSHPFMTTGKTIALTRQTFVGKVMSLLFNMLPRLVIAFLPRSKRLLISWLRSPSAVICSPRK